MHWISFKDSDSSGLIGLNIWDYEIVEIGWTTPWGSTYTLHELQKLKYHNHKGAHVLQHVRHTFSCHLFNQRVLGAVRLDCCQKQRFRIRGTTSPTTKQAPRPELWHSWPLAFLPARRGLNKCKVGQHTKEKVRSLWKRNPKKSRNAALDVSWIAKWLLRNINGHRTTVHMGNSNKHVTALQVM